MNKYLDELDEKYNKWEITLEEKTKLVNEYKESDEYKEYLEKEKRERERWENERWENEKNTTQLDTSTLESKIDNIQTKVGCLYVFMVVSIILSVIGFVIAIVINN